MSACRTQRPRRAIKLGKHAGARADADAMPVGWVSAALRTAQNTLHRGMRTFPILGSCQIRQAMRVFFEAFVGRLQRPRKAAPLVRSDGRTRHAIARLWLSPFVACTTDFESYWQSCSVYCGRFEPTVRRLCDSRVQVPLLRRLPLLTGFLVASMSVGQWRARAMPQARPSHAL